MRAAYEGGLEEKKMTTTIAAAAVRRCSVYIWTERTTLFCGERTNASARMKRKRDGTTGRNGSFVENLFDRTQQQSYWGRNNFKNR